MARPDELEKPSWVLTLASIAVITGALYLAKGILIPLTLAVLLSFLLSPVCDWLERRKLGRVPAVLSTVFLAFALLGLVTWTAIVQIRDLAPKMPEYQSNIQLKVRAANDYVKGTLKKITSTAQEIGPDLATSDETLATAQRSDGSYTVRVIPDPPSPMQLLGGMFGTLLEVLGMTGIVLVLVIFFLIRREDLRDRFIRLFGRGQVTLTTQALEDATTRVSRYLAMQLFINVTYGLPVAIGLYFIGVPNAMLWGILATVLRFLPYIGPWIAAAIPIMLSMAISKGWGPPSQTVAMFLALELFSNNVMEPWLYGKNTGVSPVAVLVAAIFWSWLWGPIGLLLATPLTVCLLVIGKHVPLLSFLDVLLGDEPVFEPKTRVYQRLLAGDQEEAGELIEELVKRMPLVEVYDEVLIPVLSSIETHRLRGDVDEARCRLMYQSLRELVEDQEQRQQAGASSAATTSSPATTTATEVAQELRIDPVIEAPKLCVLCVPARTEADDIAAIMLAQTLEPMGGVIQAVSVNTKLTELIDLVKKLRADVVCVSATAPSAVMHARTLLRYLRLRFPDTNLVAGLWDTKGELSKAEERLGNNPKTFVVGKLADVPQQVAAVVHPQLLRPPKQSRLDHDGVYAPAQSEGMMKPHIDLKNLVQEAN